ncbi:glycine/serine hydroxymethyltransferase [Mesorhizobium australicum WSM2073]|uniref:Serine hydroxymethyltransferase n=1 Tax=Mesorhizobium australicum (strain HAMBI 3006 / LMG 24608 / WSM2073) TaxID=754035 RepID=L0KFX5_MESAW|nr:serine hydroxymethyltransferase [Mesorhizobium australicum]AGB43430.1 glycine/serine hydroxymethyltransferase [Mesorhizobium australicum WSM2073]
MSDFFERTLEGDEQILKAIRLEQHRQQSEIELIASENIVSPAVLAAQGSVMTNKYAEGYPGHRYYGGCQYVDLAEVAAIERAKQLFGASYANVQPHSGAQANAAVMMAVLKPGDTFMGLSLSAGGHLTHGAKPTLSGKWFNAVQYGVMQETSLIDYDEVQAKALEHRPKLIIAGGSAYPRTIDFTRFRAIANSVGALLMVDMAHFAGLVAGGVHPNPVELADVVTTTTHKTLRGPRGGMILTNNPDLAKKLNSAVFPGLQGGPLMHVIAAKAVALGEALEDGFKTYARQMVANARMLAAMLGERGFDIVSGGTDTHLLLVDLRGKGLSGKDAEEALGRAGLTCNKNGIPFDPAPPAVTSGIRLGTPAATTRGFGEGEFARVGNLIADVLDAVGTQWGVEQEKAARRSVEELCEAFPIYQAKASLTQARTT